MKLAIAIIFALIGHMAIAQQVGKICSNGDGTKVWDGSKCVDCPTDCLECVMKGASVSCIKCKTAVGYYLKLDNDVGSCAKCVDNCQYCKGPNAADCIAPNAGFLYNTSVISACTLPGCMYCSDAGKCGKCQYGYRFDNTTNGCVACGGDGCAVCTAGVSNCTKCNYFYALNTTSQSCTTCNQAGCNECPCKTCKPKFAFVDNNCVACGDANCQDCSGNKDQCKSCPATYQLKEGKCNPCTDRNCNKCDADVAKCTECPATGFVLLKDACTACSPGCDKCSAADTCTTCSAGNWLSEKVCKPCPTNCKDIGKCNNDGTCAACADGYFMNNKVCTQCIEGCTSCADATTCTACSSAYALTKDKTCKAASSCAKGQAATNQNDCSNGTINNCVWGVNTTSAQTCASCAIGYYADGKECTPCPSGCHTCSLIAGYVSCATADVPNYFSIVTNTNAKKDNTGYLGGQGTAQLTPKGKAQTCMPNWFKTLPIAAPENTECNTFENCQYPTKSGLCYKDGKGNNGVKVAVSFFAMAVAAIFAL